MRLFGGVLVECNRSHDCNHTETSPPLIDTRSIETQCVGKHTGHRVSKALHGDHATYSRLSGPPGRGEGTVESSDSPPSLLSTYVYMYAYVPRYMCARDEYKSHNHLLPLLSPGPTTYDLRRTNYNLQRHRRPVYTIISYISTSLIIFLPSYPINILTSCLLNRSIDGTEE